METREILTLQFGHYANFVGTHFWNLQESSFVYDPHTPSTSSHVNHDVLYREGSNFKGQVTFTPRLLLCDLKGSLHSLPTSGTLYDTVGNVVEFPDTWYENRLLVQRAAPAVKNEALEAFDALQTCSSDLEDSVRVWSDYSYARYHPRTVNVINQYEHESENQQFDLFPLGTSLFKNSSFLEDFTDKIRVYVEECDNFQGFQVFLDGTDGFAGLAASCLEYINDEYQQKSILAVPVFPAHYKNSEILQENARLLNTCLCYDSLQEHSSLFVPMSTSSGTWRGPGEPTQFHRISYNHELPYHTSAILASALDTCTLRHRQKSGGYDLSDLSRDLTPRGRRLVSASLCLPFSLNQGACLIDCLDQWEGPLTKSITPNCALGTDRLMQMYVLRGISEGRLKRDQHQMAAFKCATVREMLNFYVGCNSFGSATHVTALEAGLPTKRPFPQFFDASVDSVDGAISATLRPKDTAVASVPFLAGLHSDSNIGDMLESLHSAARRIRIEKLHRFKECGLEQDDYKECLDRLFDFRECYEDSYD